MLLEYLLAVLFRLVSLVITGGSAGNPVVNFFLEWLECALARGLPLLWLLLSKLRFFNLLLIDLRLHCISDRTLTRTFLLLVSWCGLGLLSLAVLLFLVANFLFFLLPLFFVCVAAIVGIFVRVG